MKAYRCTNPECKGPILFEGNFTGTIRKKCPKCKELIEFQQFDNNKLEKIC